MSDQPHDPAESGEPTPPAEGGTPAAPAPDSWQGQPPPPAEPPYAGAPAYGQPAYGQPAYGQPAYGQPAGGQPAGGQPPYGQPGAQPGGYGYVPAGLSPQDERTWGAAAHWSALVAMVLGGMSFLGPLIVMLVQGTKSAFVRRQAVEALNFQLSMLIYGVGCFIVALTIIGLLVAVPALIVIGVLAIVMPIVGAIRASNGEDYRYPLTIRMVS